MGWAADSGAIRRRVGDIGLRGWVRQGIGDRV
jgi:hypothetical protein